VQIVIDNASRALQHTHFVCLPLTNDVVQRKATQLLQDIKGFADFAGIKGWHESIMIQPHTLHATLFVLKLFNTPSEEQASALFTSLSQKVYDTVGTRSVVLHLKGLDVMEQDVANAHVLYAKLVEDENCQRIHDAYSMCTRQMNGYIHT